MAGTNNPEHPIPMLDTAEAIVDSDSGIEPFIYSLFPEATSDTIAMIKLFAVGWFMEGEEMGRLLAEHTATGDLVSRKIDEHIFLMKGFCSYHRPHA